MAIWQTPSQAAFGRQHRPPRECGGGRGWYSVCFFSVFFFLQNKHQPPPPRYNNILIIIKSHILVIHELVYDHTEDQCTVV